ncbi:hypothetical protein NQT69_17060 [Pseudoalteromonas shioyasakiensis]|uniref:TolB family protein n=1 Tax=Pseudoalteromonas shioyasakiensis TaxID=1190813 RepID=UPI0021184156|nr:hypothetical protein [Pseudoalteromonas shioyasakiensis]MCQ8879712.1 hypothetical protein [Pseudoalteromonas shioyasakiensis]
MKQLIIATALFMASHAQAQWQTLHTEHFNLYFTAENQDWARSAAVELEIVRTKVLQQQNRSLDKTVDVVIFDPLNSANGFALPPSENPMMALFTTPPQSDTVISNSSGWQQLLILHEYIHLVHLAQPTRSDWRQAIRGLWDVYDLSYESMPRWVAEGYATLLESKMTGRGRLFDNYSEAILTEFAQQGALPSYNQLSSTQGGFMAGSMAYLMGARFLYWLENSYSEQTLDAVWTRMQGVKKRDFDTAFSGVFGDPASKLYRRFIAEYTYKAMAKEQTESELNSTAWLDLSFSASNPRLSPNQQQLAVVERDKDGNTQLVVYSTEQNLQAEEDFNKAQQALLADDPKDIANIPPEVFKRKQKQVLEQINRAGIKNPQWLNDEVLYFGAYTKNDNVENSRVADIYSWNISTGEIEQLTKLAGLRRFSITDNGQALYAERAQAGYSELVKFDIQTATATPLFEKSLNKVYDYPTLSPNKQQLAFLRTELNHNWQLYIQDLNGHNAQQVPMPSSYQYLSQPSWSNDGQSLYFIAGRNNALDIYRYNITNKQLHKLTQGQQAVANPIAMTDGSVLYFSITSDGPDLKQLTSGYTSALVTDLAPSSVAPTFKVSSSALPPAKVHTAIVGSQHDYDIWQQNSTFAIGAQYNSASAALLNLSVKGSDLLKHLDWQVGYSADLHDNAMSGAFAQAKYSAHKIKYSGQLFAFDLNSEKQYSAENVPQYSTKGGYLDAKYPLSFGEFKITPEVAYNYSEFGTKAAQDTSQQWLRAAITQRWNYDRQSFAIGQNIKARWYEGKTADNEWQGYDLIANVFGKVMDLPLYLSYRHQHRDDARLALGGFSSSLISENTHAEFAFAPELPFYAATAERYQAYGGGVSVWDGMPWLYYQQHQVDDDVFAQSYGFKWQGEFGFGLGSAGINDLHFDFGLVKVEGDSFDDELRSWLGFYYSL